MNLEKMKISNKMLILLTGLCLCIGIVGGIGLYGANSTKESLDSVYKNRVIPLKQIKLVSDAYSVQIVDTAHKVRDGAMSAEDGVRSILQARQIINEQWSAYLATNLTKEELILVDQFKKVSTNADKAVDQLVEHVRSKNLEQLRIFAARDLYPALDPLQEALGKLIELQLNETHRQYLASDADYQRNFGFITALIILCVLSAASIGYLITRSITRPLNSAVRLAEKVASGDLTSNIIVDSKNETGQLLQALKDMNESLVRIVSQVRTGTDTIATASTQIATGNLDLSSRTEEQASSLEETASSMEELTSTVKQNADNARQSNQLAMTASEVAVQGGSVVSQVVETMGSIKESANKIVDIIGV
ncbi:MCP four helix bundle domain-containing protein, partial [Oxalicibacterium faecigallinarum]|uniref:MCP four helix bundle domain-containing protein n=1 Tax=Oxalicibacterium faecigallinarum TaxID=573741 RepID=UPI002805DAE6